jgi:hypothetical protein
MKEAYHESKVPGGGCDKHQIPSTNNEASRPQADASRRGKVILIVPLDGARSGQIMTKILKTESMYHFSLLKNEFQKPKKLKESP